MNRAKIISPMIREGITPTVSPDEAIRLKKMQDKLKEKRRTQIPPTQTPTTPPEKPSPHGKRSRASELAQYNAMAKKAGKPGI